jgi:4-phytase/acid phosphatase
MVMRHSVRPPTKSPATPEGTTAQPWSTWTTPFGELTPHGAEGARLMGVYNRTFLGARGLIPRDGCAPKGEIVAWASGKSRAIKTAETSSRACSPAAASKVAHPDSEDNVRSSIRPRASTAPRLKAAQRQKPGVAAEARIHAKDFAILQRVLGCDPATKAGCDIAKRPSS